MKKTYLFVFMLIFGFFILPSMSVLASTQDLTFEKTASDSEQSVVSNVIGGEEHLYHFSLEERKLVKLEYQSDEDTFFKLLNDKGDIILRAVINHSVHHIYDEISLPPGEYTIKLDRMYSHHGDVPYSVKVELLEQNPFYEEEFNNDFETANTIQLNTTYRANLHQTSHDFQYTNDRDYYKFYVPVKGKYGFHNIDGKRITIYDAAENSIKYNDGYLKNIELELTPGMYYVSFHTTSKRGPYAFEVNALPYNDVKSSHWAVKEIAFLSDRGIINGFGDGIFRPEDSITRAQSAVMIAKALGLDTTNPKKPAFKDVSNSHWAYRAIAATTEKGIFTNSNKFNPEQTLKRSELAKVLVDAFELSGASDKTFSDVPKSHWAYSYISTLIGNEITAGFPNNTYKPDLPVTRAQFSAFLARVLDERYLVN